MIDCETEQPGAYPAIVRTRAHTFHADVTEATGGTDSYPGPHDFFDTALASCKVMTAMWYAKKNGMALERVESHVERDDTEEKTGKYRLQVRLVFHGQLSEDERARLARAVAKCPIHKLMTTSDVEIETLA